MKAFSFLQRLDNINALSYLFFIANYYDYYFICSKRVSNKFILFTTIYLLALILTINIELIEFD